MSSGVSDSPGMTPSCSLFCHSLLAGDRCYFLETVTPYLAIIPEVLISFVSPPYSPSEWRQGDLKPKFYHATTAKIPIVLPCHPRWKASAASEVLKGSPNTWLWPCFHLSWWKIWAILVNSLCKVSTNEWHPFVNPGLGDYNPPPHPSTAAFSQQ